MAQMDQQAQVARAAATVRRVGSALKSHDPYTQAAARLRYPEALLTLMLAQGWGGNVKK